MAAAAPKYEGYSEQQEIISHEKPLFRFQKTKKMDAFGLCLAGNVKWHYLSGLTTDAHR